MYSNDIIGLEKLDNSGFFRRQRRYIFLALILVVLVPAWQPAASESLPAKVAGFTPQGWQIFDRVKQFTPQNLYKQINGRASLFLAYDVIRLTFVSFVDNDDTARFIDLSIYNMGTPTNAFGIFTAERSQGGKTLNLGRASYRSGANYFIWHGPYYLRIIGSEDTDALQRIGMDLARKATASLPDSGEPVWGLNALPQIDRLPHSVQYYKVDAMGLDFMRNTYTAVYKKDNTLVTVFLSRQKSTESARSVVLQYAGYALRYGNGCDQLKAGKVELASCNMDGSFDVIFIKGRRVGGVTSVQDKDLAIRTAIEMWEQLPLVP